jgi:hypothetical protein
MTSGPGSVIRLDITSRVSPAFAGRVFDGVGTYDYLTGTVTGALDPAHALNAVIVNLDKAPRNAAGRVEYQADLAMLVPTDPARGNGWLLYDVVNRGNKLALTRLNRGADGAEPATAAHAGDGFLMRRGFSVIWSGWQGDTPPGAGRMTATLPIATDAGRPITTISREEFIAEGLGGPGDAFVREISDTTFIGTLSYPAADLDPARASLTMRVRERDPRATLPGLSWRYLDANRIEVTRPAGADRGAIYEFVYPARDPMVMGIGFAIIRDLVAHLRHGPAPANPLAGTIRHTLGFGISQSGRVLRDGVYQGFNQDFAGRPVFDAIMPVVAGSRRTCVNLAFAQTGRYSRQHEDHSYLDDQFPFTYPTLTDPVSGRTDGILQGARNAGVCPKVIHLDADSDIWNARASLVATDTAGADIAMPDDVRIFVAASTQHSVYKPAATRVTELPGNPLGYASWMRALLVALVEWVEHGTEPPASRFPSRAEGTLVSRTEAERLFPRLPGVTFPDVLNALHLRDHTVEPPVEGPEYPVLVAAPDEDGNSLGGLRHPLLTAPVGTHTGWAVRGAGYAQGDLFTVQGSYLPFPRDERERADAGDPRQSFAGRYGSRMVWVARVLSATEQLVAQRLLLREDADRLIAAIRESDDVLDVL